MAVNNREEMFSTLFCGLLDVTSGTMTYYTAVIIPRSFSAGERVLRNAARLRPAARDR